MMKDWNVVINIHDRGLKQAYQKLGRFGRIGKTGFFNVLFMEADDIHTMIETFREWTSEDPHALAFLSRVVPVRTTFIFQSPEEFKSRAKEAVLAWVHELAGKSFHVRMRRRGFKGKLSSLDEERFLDDTLLEALAKAGTPGHITFGDPDVIIAVETIAQWAGLALWSREDLRRYPFIKLD